MTALASIPCTLCYEKDRFLAVKVPGRDGHITSYGEIYAGRTISEWKICGSCWFVHQNPRPTKQALNRYYLDGKYRQKRVFPEVNRYKEFAEWYYGKKVAYASAKTGLLCGTVFDLRCGYGAALHVFSARGWRAL